MVCWRPHLAGTQQYINFDIFALNSARESMIQQGLKTEHVINCANAKRINIKKWSSEGSYGLPPITVQSALIHVNSWTVRDVLYSETQKCQNLHLKGVICKILQKPYICGRGGYNSWSDGAHHSLGMQLCFIG